MQQPVRQQKFTFAVSVVIATTALLTACALATGRFCAAPAPATVTVATPSIVPAAVDIPPAPLDEDELNKARQAARDFVRETYPGSKTDGVFALSFGPRTDLALCGVDTRTSEGTRVTVDLLVRRYVRKNGGAYWRAESFGRNSAAYEAALAQARQQAGSSSDLYR